MEWNSMKIEFDYKETITGPQIQILKEGLKESELTDEEIRELDAN
jgi:hypothetical protein